MTPQPNSTHEFIRMGCLCFSFQQLILLSLRAGQGTKPFIAVGKSVNRDDSINHFRAGINHSRCSPSDSINQWAMGNHSRCQWSMGSTQGGIRYSGGHGASFASGVWWRRYYVMAPGNEGKAIFRDDGDRQRFLETLAEMVGRFGVRLHAFYLMPNHYHLLHDS